MCDAAPGADSPKSKSGSADLLHPIGVKRAVKKGEGDRGDQKAR